ncbi:hypothetical protein [Nonomuraea dietziae]|uniref:hypothetical protein n=1 Tax=Nonomuraea dietziae TaxID=65515 RepID=UPI0031D3D1D0
MSLLTLSCITPAPRCSSSFPRCSRGRARARCSPLLAGVAVSIAVGCCYAELGTLKPSSGGEYAMVTAYARRV